MTSPDRMASMMAALVNGTTLEQAIASGLVVGAADRSAWLRLRAAVSEIQQRGDLVEIPVEPLA